MVIESNGVVYKQDFLAAFNFYELINEILTNKPRHNIALRCLL